MKYLIVQQWNSTKGNHAGMVHMCNLLAQRYPDDYRVIVHDEVNSNRHTGYKIFDFLYRQYYKSPLQKIVYTRNYISLCNSMFKQLCDGDEVFLLEYLLPNMPQLGIAEYIKKNFKGVRVYALSHLTVSNYKTKFKNPESTILKWAKPVDKMLTLGSSLSEYFISIGLREKVSTGFHYVDSNYYNCKNTISRKSERITAIAMGALQRDYTMLSEIVNATPEIDWIICRGRKNVDELFQKRRNIVLKGFVEEDELRQLMAESDLSVNILDDTVGSNVITTSMAMELGIVVSDVGSIRDYCSSSNAIFCTNDKEDFIFKLNNISHDYSKLSKMKEESLRMSQRLSIENVNTWFNSLK